MPGKWARLSFCQIFSVWRLSQSIVRTGTWFGICCCHGYPQRTTRFELRRVVAGLPEDIFLRVCLTFSFFGLHFTPYLSWPASMFLRLSQISSVTCQSTAVSLVWVGRFSDVRIKPWSWANTVFLGGWGVAFSVLLPFLLH